MAGSKRKTRPQAPQKQQRVYESDGDSDASDGPPPAPVPLQSLERAGVRDFVAEFQQQTANSSKPTSKRARAELQQLEIDAHKSQFRAERAEKVVWRKFAGENKVFAQYYRRQLALDADADWSAFEAALRTPLGVHLRVNANYASLSEIVGGQLQLDFQLDRVHLKRDDGDVDHTTITLKPLAWDPLVWKLSLDAKSLRKAKELQELSSYLHTHQVLGTLQRMDPVSAMLPLFLAPEPGHRVLDLCGGGEIRAPGIIERMRDQGRSSGGALVVNEPDAAAAAKAAQTLAKTLALSTEALVTSHKPLEFPSPVDTSGGVFDRVLCSAPCSGDGLIRKIPERWRTWTPLGGLQSHATQVALVAKAMALVTVGGSLLYATRSLNPIENEAVVAELLRTGDGAYELVDVDGVAASTLQRTAGLTTWDVMDDQLNRVSMWEAATPAQKKVLRASMWPPTEEQADAWGLKRCVRVHPNANDTNALFLALIKKMKEPTTAAVQGPAVPASTKTQKLTKQQKKETRKVLGSLSELASADVDRIVDLYGVPRSSLGVVMERSGFAKDASVHLVSALASALLTTDFGGRLHVHRAGVDAFRKSTLDLTDDGARCLLPVLRRRVLQLSLDEFTTLLTKKEMWLKHASEDAQRVLAEATSHGSVVVVVDDMEPVQTADQDLVLVASKRQSSYSLTSSTVAIARAKTLLKELAQDEDDEDDGYDSMELEE